MKYLILVLSVVVLAGCNITAHKLKKAQKLINEAKARGAQFSVDTIKSKKKVQGDSNVVNINTRDSVVISTKDSLVINNKDTTIYHTTHKTIYEKLDTIVVVNGIKVHIKINGKKLTVDTRCPDKEIEVATALNETINCPPEKTTWRTVALILAALLVVLFFIMKK